MNKSMRKYCETKNQKYPLQKWIDMIAYEYRMTVIDRKHISGNGNLRHNKKGNYRLLQLKRERVIMRTRLAIRQLYECFILCDASSILKQVSIRHGISYVFYASTLLTMIIKVFSYVKAHRRRAIAAVAYMRMQTQNNAKQFSKRILGAPAVTFWIHQGLCTHTTELSSLQLRHNERDSVSNHQRFDCLLNRLFRGRSKKTSKLRVTGLREGNSPVTGEFPANGQ